jgi:hypothetical protein
LWCRFQQHLYEYEDFETTLNTYGNLSLSSKSMLTEVAVVQVTVVVVTGSVVTITPADDVDTLSDREIGTANPGMDTCK